MSFNFFLKFCVKLDIKNVKFHLKICIELDTAVIEFWLKQNINNVEF